MKRTYVAVALIGALVAAVGSAVAVHLLGAPEWAPWLTLFVSFWFYAIGFLIILEAVAEEAPQFADTTDETPVGLELLQPAERRTFKPQPHFEAEPTELFAGLINAGDATVVMAKDYQGRRRAGAK